MTSPEAASASESPAANMPLTIALIMSGGRQWVGGITYIENIAAALRSLPEAERRGLRVKVVAQSADRELLGRVERLTDEVAWIDGAGRSLVSRLKGRLKRTIFGIDEHWMADLLADLDADFVYPLVRGRNSRAHYRAAAWIPDFQHKHLPGFFTAAELKDRDAHLGHVARDADRVVLSSEAARIDFDNIYPGQRAKARVLRFRSEFPGDWFTEPPGRTLAAYHLPDRYLLVCNQLWAHKNHALVLDALQRLAGRGVRPQVVMTGQLDDYRNPSHRDEFLASIHRSGLWPQIRLMGLVPRRDQVQMMRAALAVIQPSRFEGWSTVVEDARSLGKPVLMSDIPVHREQAPAGGRYFGVEDAEELAAGLLEVWEGKGGFDADAEQEAQSRQRDLVRDFGREFVSLAREPMSCSRVATSRDPESQTLASETTARRCGGEMR